MRKIGFVSVLAAFAIAGVQPALAAAPDDVADDAADVSVPDEATDIADDGVTDEVIVEDETPATELEDPDVIFYMTGGGADDLADEIAEQTASNVLDEIDTTGSVSATAPPN